VSRFTLSRWLSGLFQHLLLLLFFLGLIIFPSAGYSDFVLLTAIYLRLNLIVTPVILSRKMLILLIPNSRFVGLSIHYNGTIKNARLIPNLVDEVKDICLTLQWNYHLFEVKRLNLRN